MKSIIKTRKRGIIAILTLFILLGIAGTCVNVSAMAAGTTATVKEDAVTTEEIKIAAEKNTVATGETTATTDETTPELMPMMAKGCGYGNLKSWHDIDHDTKDAILGDVSGNYAATVGYNPDIYYGSNQLIYLCGTGQYKGRTYATNLYRSDYL